MIFFISFYLSLLISLLLSSSVPTLNRGLYLIPNMVFRSASKDIFCHSPALAFTPVINAVAVPAESEVC